MDLLTVQETARLLRVTPITIRRYIADGRLPALKVGKAVRVERQAVERLLAPIGPAGNGSERPAPAGRPLSYDDPLWQLVGSASSPEPTDASRKYDELGDAPDPRAH
jgi:excisionase family DNA binding protein